MSLRLSSMPWCGIKRMFAQTDASVGSTLRASEPDCMVNATVVCSIAPACADTVGSTSFNSGLNSHMLPKRSFIPKPAYGASVSNIASTSCGKRFLNGLCFSTLFSKAASLAMGEFLGGALECPPPERAVNFTLP